MLDDLDYAVMKWLYKTLYASGNGLLVNVSTPGKYSDSSVV